MTAPSQSWESLAGWGYFTWRAQHTQNIFPKLQEIKDPISHTCHFKNSSIKYKSLHAWFREWRQRQRLRVTSISWGGGGGPHHSSDCHHRWESTCALVSTFVPSRLSCEASLLRKCGVFQFNHSIALILLPSLQITQKLNYYKNHVLTICYKVEFCD